MAVAGTVGDSPEIGQVNDTPDDVIFDHFQEVAYPDQPLGRPVLGRPEIVRSMERDRLIDYIATNYGPASSVIAASGEVDHDAFVALCRNASTIFRAPAVRVPSRDGMLVAISE